MFESLKQLPQDPILQLMQMFRDDIRPDKVDLGVGVYKDDAGSRARGDYRPDSDVHVAVLLRGDFGGFVDMTCEFLVSAPETADYPTTRRLVFRSKNCSGVGRHG